MTPNITNNTDNSRLETEVDGHRGWLDYRVEAGKLILLHTEVEPALSGKGVGSALVEAAVEFADREGLDLVPHCGYAAARLKRMGRA